MSTQLKISYLNLLFNLSLQLVNLLCEGLFASGQLGDKSFFLFNLTAELTLCENYHQTLVCVQLLNYTLKITVVECCVIRTIFCQQTCFLCTQVIDLTDIFIILGLQFAKLVLKSTAHLFQISLEKKDREK